MEQEPKETLWIKPIAIFVVFLCFVVLAISGVRKDIPSSLTFVQSALPTSTPVVLLKNPFSAVTISAKSAYVVDISDHTALFSLNSDIQLPLASLTKIMTAVSAEKIASTTSEIVITKAALQQDGDNGLLLGERWTLDNLLRFTLLVSSNDGAYAIGNAFEGFIGTMNDNAKNLGLQKTYFMNESGLDVSQGLSGGYGSAKDVARLFEYAVSRYPSVFDITKRESASFTSENNIVHSAENTDKIIDKIPGLIASKTGTTDLAGGNLVIEFLPKGGHPVVAVVMGSTVSGRFDDMLALVHATERYFDINGF